MSICQNNHDGKPCSKKTDCLGCNTLPEDNKLHSCKPKTWQEGFDDYCQLNFTEMNLKLYVRHELKFFISKLLSEQEESFYHKLKQDEMIKGILADQREDFIKKIESRKKATQKTGTYKYDGVYDEIIEIIYGTK